MSFNFNVNSPAFKGAAVVSSTPAVETASKAGQGDKSEGALLHPEQNDGNRPPEKVRVTGQFAQFQHGAGCSHCTAGITQKVFEGRPDEIQSMMANAAQQAHSQNVATIKSDVERHEAIHFSRASSNPLLKVGAPQINTGAIEAMAAGKGGGTLGSVQIQPPPKNAKTAQEARQIADAFKTMAYAANAGAADASGADKSVAAAGQAGEQEMLAKAEQLEKQGKGGDKNGAQPQPPQGGNQGKAKKPQGNFSISA